MSEQTPDGRNREPFEIDPAVFEASRLVMWEMVDEYLYDAFYIPAVAIPRLEILQAADEISQAEVLFFEDSCT